MTKRGPGENRGLLFPRFSISHLPPLVALSLSPFQVKRPQNRNITLPSEGRGLGVSGGSGRRYRCGRLTFLIGRQDELVSPKQLLPRASQRYPAFSAQTRACSSDLCGGNPHPSFHCLPRWFRIAKELHRHLSDRYCSLSEQRLKQGGLRRTGNRTDSRRN